MKDFRQKISDLIDQYQNLTHISVRFFSINRDGNVQDSASGDLFSEIVQFAEDEQMRCTAVQKSAILKAAEEKSSCELMCGSNSIQLIVPIFKDGEVDGCLLTDTVAEESSDDSKNLKQLLELLVRMHGLGERAGMAAGAGITALQDERTVPDESLPLSDGSQEETGALENARKNVGDVIGFLSGQKLEHLPSDYPLSYYLNTDKLDNDYLVVFWKTIEIMAGDIFNCVMSGNYEEGRRQFDEMMRLAYSEPEVRATSSAAEMLFHIIFMKYFSKELFDLRFYRLAFDAANSLQGAKNVDEVRRIMGQAYQTMYSFYNGTKQNLRTASISKAIITYLEDNYSSSIHLEDIGRHFYMSSTYLNRLFKEQTGGTIKQCLLNIRMSKAQKLLLSTNLPVSAIAERVGYRNSIRGFYKIFKQHFGMTCAEMRKKNRSG